MFYIKALQNIWDGRVDQDATSLRFHQAVQLQDIVTLKSSDKNKAYGIVGFQSDEGVRRNKGRVGAAQAPNEIRKFLAGVSYPFGEETNVIDTGNIACEGSDLENAQAALASRVTGLLDKYYTPVILGGGHETFYGHYTGVRRSVGKNASIGMINIDAHFDLRTDAQPSSGTMFQQILSEDENADYLCLGIQELANTKTLFDEAGKHGATYILEENIKDFDHTFRVIDEFVKQHDYIVVTLCSDSILVDAAPGVSAPAPFGLEPKVVKKLLHYLVAKEKTLSFDISEVNPELDTDGQTARLAAYLVAEVMRSFHTET